MQKNKIDKLEIHGAQTVKSKNAQRHSHKAHSETQKNTMRYLQIPEIANRKTQHHKRANKKPKKQNQHLANVQMEL